MVRTNIWWQILPPQFRERPDNLLKWRWKEERILAFAFSNSSRDHNWFNISYNISPNCQDKRKMFRVVNLCLVIKSDIWYVWSVLGTYLLINIHPSPAHLFGVSCSPWCLIGCSSHPQTLSMFLPVPQLVPDLEIANFLLWGTDLLPSGSWLRSPKRGLLYPLAPLIGLLPGKNSALKLSLGSNPVFLLLLTYWHF